VKEESYTPEKNEIAQLCDVKKLRLSYLYIATVSTAK